MELLPKDILPLIGEYLNINDDWVNFQLTCKHIFRSIQLNPLRPQVDISFNKTMHRDKYSLCWKGKYTTGYTWCRGTRVSLNDICNSKCYWTEENYVGQIYIKPADDKIKITSPKEMCDNMSWKEATFSSDFGNINQITGLFWWEGTKLYPYMRVVLLQSKEIQDEIQKELSYIHETGLEYMITFDWV